MLIKTHKHFRFYTLILLFLVLLSIVLYQARILFIPLSFAFLVSVMYYPVGKWIERWAGRSISIFVCLLMLLVFGILLYNLLASSFGLLQRKISGSKDRILELGDSVLQLLNDFLGIAPDMRETLLQRLNQNILEQVFPLVKQTISLSANTLAMFLIVPIFVSLILYYRELLVKFTLMVVPQKQIEGFKATIKETTSTYFKFAKGMAIVYLIVGVLNSIGFMLLGLPNAIYLGILASLLTFFPYIGIMIGGAAAVIVAWATYDSIWYPLGVVGILGIVQYLEANLIFPVIVGHQLRLNPLATLIVIILGGIIWGGAGMILFVPFAAILKILADRIDGLQALAVLLGPASSTTAAEDA
jgi:predicted PurR-regulated permease PerM